jgi:hypothetical protein
MPPPYRDDELTRMAALFASEDAKKKGKKPPDLRKLFRATPEGFETAEISPGGIVRNTVPGSDQRPLQGAGYQWMPGEDFEGELSRARTAIENPQAPITSPPPGKLPFISNTPTHEAPPGYSNRLPAKEGLKLSDPMFSRPLGPKPPAAPPARAAGSPGGMAGVKRSLEVHTTSSTGAQPTLREFQPLDGQAPDVLERRLGGLPEGVAKEMRKRWGLEDAQADSNRRALAVELASAGNQIGSGIAGVRYDDSTWDNQRGAARQPVADFQTQSDEKRAQDEAERRAAEDERDARAAEAAAHMELQKFEYGKGRDKSQDQLQRDRMAQEKTLAEARLRSEALDRGDRREERSFRLKEGAEIKQQMADQREAERKARAGDLDLQRLGAATSKAPFGELQSALEEIDRQVPGLAFGRAPDDAPMGAWDRSMSALAPVGGEWLMSDKGKKYSTVIGNLRDLVSRMRSGAVLNEGEERHYLELLGDRVLSDPRSAAAGIDEVRRGVAQKLKNAQGGFVNSGALDDYEKTGATTFRNPIFSATGRRVPVVDPNGRTATMDESELADALKDGWRRR